jgi:ferredoxin
VRVTVDLTRCNGYANCLMEAPEVFELDDETGLAVVLQEEPAEEKRGEVEAAMRACPMRAIALEG